MERPIYQGKAPYQLYRIYGPYRKSKTDNRFTIRGALKGGTPKDRISVNYARYLMEIHLGRFLSLVEHVHHKDGNPLNDVLDNLELISPAKHNTLHFKKYHKFTIPLEMSCACCGKMIYMSVEKLNLMAIQFTKRKIHGPFCSGKCSNQVAVNKQQPRLDTFTYRKVK